MGCAAVADLFSLSGGNGSVHFFPLAFVSLICVTTTVGLEKEKQYMEATYTKNGRREEQKLLH